MQLRVRQQRASVVEKLPAALARQAPSGSFDSAPLSTAAPDKPSRRSAQDDGFAGVLMKNIPIRLTLMGLRPGLSSAVPTGLIFMMARSHADTKALIRARAV